MHTHLTPCTRSGNQLYRSWAPKSTTRTFAVNFSPHPFLLIVLRFTHYIILLQQLNFLALFSGLLQPLSFQTGAMVAGGSIATHRSVPDAP